MLTAQVLDASYPEYPFFVGVGEYDVCRIGHVADRRLSVGTPLQSNVRQRARDLGQSLATNTSAPPDVRSAGRCLYQTIVIDDRAQAIRSQHP